MRKLRTAAIALLLLFVGLGGLGLGRALRPGLRDGISLSQAYFDSHGRLLRLTLAGDDRYRLWVPLERISPALVEATLLQEDQHFRAHPGVNPVALARAFFATYLARGKRVGGSTLTMQLARRLYGIESRRLPGKWLQIARALQLELLYSKSELLEAYLNLASYGGNLEEAGAASLVYFHKDAFALTAPEALWLAVIPQSPARRSLADLSRGDAGRPARQRLARRWLEARAVSGMGAAERERFATQLRAPLSTHTPGELPFLAPHFVEALRRRAPEGDRVLTTLDLELQTAIERRTREYIEHHADRGLHNASVLLLDWETMEVRALVGSVDYFDPSIAGQVNGTDAKRSPGSALKPFIYGLAIDQGLIHPQTMLKDTPRSFGAFDPENFDQEFAGPVHATEALVRSRNLPAVALASQLKDPSLYQFLERAGITRLRSEEHYGLSVALGGTEVTPMELARLYALLPNEGVLQPLRFVPPEASAPRARSGPRLLSPEASFLVLDMLGQNPRPDQRFESSWTRDPISVAWKTGTSQGFHDAWSAGVFGKYVLVVWVGNFDGTPSPSLIGREAAGPLFFELVDGIRALRPQQQQWLAPRPPAGSKLVRTRVCALSGDLPGPHCQHTIQTWFIPGKSPIRTCAIHRQIEVDPRTGFRLCRPGTAPSRSEIHEFWPSDLLQLFAAAGIPRRPPPPFDPRCSLESRSAKGGGGLAPVITSPRENLSYALRKGGERIPLAATTDGDVRDLYWFTNGEFVGRSAAMEPLLWKARPGDFVFRVVDDQGRVDSREVRVLTVQ